MNMQLELREKKYFDERATREMAQHLHSSKRTVQGSLAYATRILAMTGQEAGLAAQLTARSERPKCYWTLHFGLGFDEATPEDFIEVDADLKTVRASGSDQEAAEVERRLAA
jgi:L-fuculose-phosphate aldolase